MDAKAEMRRNMLSRRDLVSPREAQAAAKVIAREGAAFAKASCAAGAVVAAYWPIRSEIGTRALIEGLSAAGFRTALPVVVASRRPLQFRLWTPDQELEHGSFGLSHPGKDAPTTIPDLLFLPLAAFDSRGYRIGYGGGHYDATLAELHAQGKRTAVGLAYAIQEVDTVPHEPHDQRLDFVITEERVMTCGAG